MPPTGGADGERINVFPVGDRYLFRHYFDEEVFDLVRRYYDNREYRFDVPARRFDPLRAALSDRGYELRVVADAAPYAVVVRKYRRHPENVFNAAVIQRHTPDHNVFVLRDKRSVALAVKQGATRLVDTDIDLDPDLRADTADAGDEGGDGEEAGTNGDARRRDAAGTT
ncbi:MAG: hypothetical protein ABEH40_02800 [Haloferacaceae archaeon]